jgi:hypothetical protein
MPDQTPTVAKPPLADAIARAARSSHPLRQMAWLIGGAVVVTILAGALGAIVRDGAPPAPPPATAGSPKLAPSR